MTHEDEILEEDDFLAEQPSAPAAGGVYSATVGEFDAGQRLDKFLARQLPELSRTRVQALIEEGSVSSSGKPVTTLSKKVQVNDVFEVIVPPPVDSTIPAVAMDLDIVYEDDDILVINKAAGMTVHPAPGHYDDTLVNGLLHHCKGSLSGIGGVARPGIVHRIDKDTSGLLVVAKHDQAHASLAKQLKARTLKRIYLAVSWGLIPYGEGSIEADIGRNPRDRKKMAVVKTGGKPAVTHYNVLESYSFNRVVPGKRDTLQREDLAALVECELETGRTHQIRVHMAHHGYALIGDALYAPETDYKLRGSLGASLPPSLYETLLGFKRQALHARALTLIHPATHEEMQFEAPLPDDFLMLLEQLRLLHL